MHIEADNGYYEAELELHNLAQMGAFYFCSNSHPH